MNFGLGYKLLWEKVQRLLRLQKFPIHTHTQNNQQQLVTRKSEESYTLILEGQKFYLAIVDVMYKIKLRFDQFKNIDIMGILYLSTSREGMGSRCFIIFCQCFPTTLQWVPFCYFKHDCYFVLSSNIYVIVWSHQTTHFVSVTTSCIAN
jgi:hypothetical protein